MHNILTEILGPNKICMPFGTIVKVSVVGTDEICVLYCRKSNSRAISK